jgi:putative membrane protein
MNAYDLPLVNAGLNGCAAVLLLLGFVAIKRRRVQLHKSAMLAALAASVLFLSSYLYYHLVVRQGQSTRYEAAGLQRIGYLALLLSHTVLAAVAAPMAIVTACLGISKRLTWHVRLARITFPIWLYVSVTGVLLYLILKDHYPTGPLS